MAFQKVLYPCVFNWFPSCWFENKWASLQWLLFLVGPVSPCFLEIWLLFPFLYWAWFKLGTGLGPSFLILDMSSSYNLPGFLVPCVKDQDELSKAVLPNAFGKLHRLTFSRHGRLTGRQVLIYPCCGWETLKFTGTVTKAIELDCRQNRFLIQCWKRPDLTQYPESKKV